MANKKSMVEIIAENYRNAIDYKMAQKARETRPGLKGPKRTTDIELPDPDWMEEATRRKPRGR